MLVSLTVDIISLFQGPFGHAAGPVNSKKCDKGLLHWASLPTLKSLPAFNTNSWLFVFLEICEATKDNSLLILLKKIWNLQKLWYAYTLKTEIVQRDVINQNHEI